MVHGDHRDCERGSSWAILPLGDTETLEVICEVEQGHVTRKTIYNNYIRPEEDTVAFNYFIQEIRSHDWDSYPELKDRTLHGKLMAYPRTDGVADSVGRVELYVNGGKGEERYHRTVTDPADPWIVLVAVRPGDTPLGGVFHQGKSEAGGNLFYYQTSKDKRDRNCRKGRSYRFAQGVGEGKY